MRCPGMACEAQQTDTILGPLGKAKTRKPKRDRLMAGTAAERVLVVPTELLHRLGYFQGFMPGVEGYLDTLLSRQHTSYRPREEMEVDPSFKQLIPYVIFCHRDADGRLSVFTHGEADKASSDYTESTVWELGATSRPTTLPV